MIPAVTGRQGMLACLPWIIYLLCIDERTGNSGNTTDHDTDDYPGCFVAGPGVFV